MSDKGSDLKLALNRWEPGQILRPEHFRAQEEALLDTTLKTARLAGLPFYGLGRLEWDEASLANGTVLITQLTVVFGPGPLVVVRNNATLPPLQLEVKGSTVSLYLSLCSTSDRETEIGLYHDDAPTVAREIHRLQLSTTESVDDSVALLKLAELEKGKSGWRLASTYVPPLLQVGTSPFLLDALREVGVAAATLYEALRRQLLSTFCRGEAMALARRGQLAAYRIRTVLADLDQGICRHPYHYLEALRAFHLELCLLKNVEPAARDPRAYDHDDLAGCFNALMQEIKGLAVNVSVASPSLDFTRKEGEATFHAAPFPDALLGAAEVYLVVWRPDATPSVPFDDIKLASPTQLDKVQISSLRGVRLKRVEASFQHSFGPWVDLYQLQCSGSEAWARAVAERALAYYARDELKNIPTALFWRTP